MCRGKYASIAQSQKAHSSHIMPVHLGTWLPGVQICWWTMRGVLLHVPQYFCCVPLRSVYQRKVFNIHASSIHVPAMLGNASLSVSVDAGGSCAVHGVHFWGAHHVCGLRSDLCGPQAPQRQVCRAQPAQVRALDMFWGSGSEQGCGRLPCMEGTWGIISFELPCLGCPRFQPRSRCSAHSLAFQSAGGTYHNGRMILILAIELQLFMVLTPRLAMGVGTTSVVRNTDRACDL